jgi:hypothetical protein
MLSRLWAGVRKDRAASPEQAFENYLAVLMVSLLALFPDMSLISFGRITLLPSVHETRLIAMRRHVSTMIGFGLLIYSAGRMAFDGHDMRDTMAAATIVLLFSATEKAWGLLNRIATAKP